MNINNIIEIIIFFVLIIIIIIFIIIKKENSQSSDITESDKQNNIDCPISKDYTQLKICDPSNVDECTNCNQGLYSCVNVSNDNPYKVKDDQGNNYNIPNGNFCLPPIYETLPCNQYSGVYVLRKINNNEFAWTCECKYPFLLQNAGSLGNCTYEVACGANVNSQNHLVCPTGATYCTPGTTWNNSTGGSQWDPKYGVCQCDTGLMYKDYSNGDVYRKECITDTCTPGITVDISDNKSCTCPERTSVSYTGYTGYVSYIACPNSSMRTGLCTDDSPLCLPDPCNPHGYWDNENATCTCDQNNGWYPYTTENSIMNQICFQPCSDQNNPCGVGPYKRGDCIYDPANKIGTCTNCTDLWTQESKNDDPYQTCKKRLSNIGENCDKDSDCARYTECGNGVCYIKTYT